jgi:hypothetical protein
MHAKAPLEYLIFIAVNGMLGGGNSSRQLMIRKRNEIVGN